MNTENSPKPVTPVRCSALLDDWIPIQMTAIWYRFGRLTNPKRRLSEQIPLGFGWVFSTYKYLLTDVNLPPEQNHNHSYPTAKIRKRLEFWKRWFDPVILGPATLCAQVLEAGRRLLSMTSSDHLDERERPPETLVRSNRPLAVLSPSNGLCSWLNLGAIKREFYVHHRENTDGVLRNASYFDGAKESNDPSSATGADDVGTERKEKP